MTASDLKYKVEQAEYDRYFFTRDTMKFFGDTMRNYGVRDGGTIINNLDEKFEVWELYRKHPVKHGMSDSAYFCKSTFKIINRRIGK